MDNQEDIKKYLDEQINKRACLDSISLQLQDDIKSTFLDRSQGMYVAGDCIAERSSLK